MWRLLAGLVLVVGLSFATAPSASAQYCTMGTSNTVPGFRNGANINPLYGGGYQGYQYYPFNQAWYGGNPSFYSSYYNGYPYGQYPSGGARTVATLVWWRSGGGSQPYFGAGYVDPTFYDVAALGNYVNPYYSDIVGNMPFWTGQYGGSTHTTARSTAAIRRTAGSPTTRTVATRLTATAGPARRSSWAATRITVDSQLSIASGGGRRQPAAVGSR